MTHDYEWDEELHPGAVRKLIANHRDEYAELTGHFRELRIYELEQQLVATQKQLAYVRDQNPHEVAVPAALEETANLLAKKNDELRDLLVACEREKEGLSRKLTQLDGAISNAFRERKDKS